MRPYAASPAIEGARANSNPYASMIAGQPLAAGPLGVIVGRFGWADPVTGQVANTPGANGALGFVLPVWGSWQRLYCNEGLWILRSGQRITLASRGDFWCRFLAGAFPGQPVFASLLDGSAAVGMDDDINYQLTQWIATTQAAPGALAMISPWAYFSNMQ